MKFHKMHGAGNDFIVVDAVDGDPRLDPASVRALCDRRTGIGADGILLVGAPDGRRWPMEIHNADGSRGDACGNGARCVARYLLDRHGGDDLEIATSGGLMRARRHDAGIAVELDPPHVLGRVTVAETREATVVDTGNRHAVVFLEENLAAVDLPALARLVRGVDGADDCNVEIVRVLAADEIEIRVDERGVGETLACGTGACASVAAVGRTAAATVRVHLPGGTLVVRRGERSYELAGPAEYVFEGTV